MSILRKVLHAMGTFLDSIKGEITSIHSTAGISDQVTADVHTAVDAAFAPFAAAQAASDARITDLETVIKQMADQLTAGDTAAALATAQAATPAPSDAAAAASTDTSGSAA